MEANKKQKRFKGLGYIILILSSLSLAMITFNIIQYRDFNALLAKPELYQMVVMILVLITFIFHIVILFIVSRIVRKYVRLGILGMATVVIGIVSLISFYFDWAALTDIIRDLPAGYNVKFEMIAVTLCTITQLIFTLLSFFIASTTFSESIAQNNMEEKYPAELLFGILNLSGIICGLIGLGVTYYLYTYFGRPQSFKWTVLPYTGFILLPYIIVLASWLLNSAFKKPLFDEKQLQDIKKAGFITWILSFPLMIFMFIFNYYKLDGWISVLWLPFYLFGSLILFSLLSMFYYKK